MKTNDFNGFARVDTRIAKPSRRALPGIGAGTAILGLACGIGVFAVLALLYHFG